MSNDLDLTPDNKEAALAKLRAELNAARQAKNHEIVAALYEQIGRLSGFLLPAPSN